MKSEPERIRREPYPRVKADYVAYPGRRFRGNPFVEALRSRIVRGVDILERFKVEPEVPGESDRLLDDDVRLEDLGEICDVIFPRPGYDRAAKNFDSALKEAYYARNAASAEDRRRRALIASAGSMKGLRLPMNWKSSATGIAMFGPTGGGKSTFLNCQALPYQVIIEHTSYGGVDLVCEQIPVLMMHMPHDGTLKGFCIQFLQTVDDVRGIELYEGYANSRRTLAEMMYYIGKVVTTLSIGMIVVEDLQNLRAARGPQLHYVLSMFSAIIEFFGVSMAFTGTPAIDPLLSSSVRDIRKLTQGGETRLGCMAWDSPELRLYQDYLWRYQWVRRPGPLDDGIRWAWFEVSGGNPAFMNMTFIFAQRNEIGRGDDGETITADSFYESYMCDMSLLHPAIEALVSGKPSLLSAFDDLVFDGTYDEIREQLGYRPENRKSSDGDEFAEMGIAVERARESKPSGKARSGPRGAIVSKLDQARPSLDVRTFQ